MQFPSVQERRGILGLLIILSLTLFENVYSNTPALCQGQASCDSCIATAGCTWCKELKSSHDNFQRCNTKQGHVSSKCSGGDIVEAGLPTRNIIKNEALSKSMRITPQEVNLKLPVGQEVEVELRYNDSLDKPLDLYYIMDLSATMEDDKNTVSTQAVRLRNELGKITKNISLGFGSFIDKPVLPFVSASQLRPNHHKYEVPYGFKNELKLTDNVSQFEIVVRNAKISRNLDEPEGTLDALMQAITCKDEIGWRNESRKLIVVATDGLFHIAGDGKLGGIIRPNDMKCHMENGMYTHSTLLDYPSVGEINAVINHHKVYVIFAVSTLHNDEVFNVYRELQNHITQSIAQKLEANSNNVVEKIKEKYEEISQTVNLTIENPPRHVDITVLAKCSVDDTWRQQSYCQGVTVAKEIRFKLKIKLNRCPSPQYTGQNKIVVSFFELTTREKLEINLSYACTCGCNNETIQDEINLTKFCTGPTATKHVTCGVCNCHEGRRGQSCECSDINAYEQGTENCKSSPTSVPCNDRGRCECGQCKCWSQEEFHGKYCEYSTVPCINQESGKVCSDNGYCSEEKCTCAAGFEGPHCECVSKNRIACVEPGAPVSRDNECSGRGTCQCNVNEAKCKCNQEYGGRYCEVCKVNNCPADKEAQRSRCGDMFLQECVKCRTIHAQNENSTRSTLEQNSCGDVCNWNEYKANMTQNPKGSISVRGDVDSIDYLETTNLDVEGIKCQVQINSTCFAEFVYNYATPAESRTDLNVLQVFYIPNGVTCQKEPAYIWMILGVILSVLVAGILMLLIWKLATHLHDKREYRRFEKETKNTKWAGGQNPLYRVPMSEFENPAREY